MAAARAGSASGSRWFKSPLVMALLCVIPVAAIGYHFLPTSSKPVDGTLTASTPPPNSSINSYPANASPAPPPMRDGSAPHHPRPSQPAGSHVDGSAATLGSSHESTPSVPPGSIAFSGQVINARTNDYIAHARVIVFLDGRPSSEQFTDSRGRFFFNLGEIPKGTGGLLYSSAPNFTTLKRNFVITGSSMSYDLPLQPANAASSSRH
jgi:hypothetical protein